MSIDTGQLLAFIAALIGAISTLAGLVHKGDLERIKDRDTIITDRDKTIAEQKAVIARFEAEAVKAMASKDQEIAEWRKVSRTALERTVP